MPGGVFHPFTIPLAMVSKAILIHYLLVNMPATHATSYPRRRKWRK